MASKTAVLHVDLLGVRSMWSGGNRAVDVATRLDLFYDFILKESQGLPAILRKQGELSVYVAGDSATFLCSTADQAVLVSQRLLAQAFFWSDKVEHPLWLRGAITGWHGPDEIMSAVPIQVGGHDVGERHAMVPACLEAVALEKAGFKGMRVIVDMSLFEDRRCQLSTDWNCLSHLLYVVTRLKEFDYLGAEGYADVLWMVESENKYDALLGIMESRFKRSTRSMRELEQAAWTRAVFDQVASLVFCCR